LSETYLILKRIQDNIVINENDLHVKHPLFLSHCNETWIFSAGFRKTLKFHENPSRGSQVVPCGQCKRAVFRERQLVYYHNTSLFCK